MPLQHSHEEQPAPLSSSRTITPLDAPQEMQSETPVIPVNSADAPRYDAATVKQIIALAEQMQTHHRQTLTPEEVEALGHEVGVEPKFIRRALAQMSASTTSTASTTASDTLQHVANVKPSLFPLTQGRSMLLMAPLVAYLFLLPYTWTRIDVTYHASSSTDLFLFAILPAALSLYLGVKGKSRRFGALVGALSGFICLGSMSINIVAHHHYMGSPVQILASFAVWMAWGLAFGFGGAAARKLMDKPRRQARGRRTVTAK